jgi:glutamyl-tRNA synthetase
METLHWLGLNWDEGPFYQMERLEDYRRRAEELLVIGKAYRCYCTTEELEEKRQQAMAERRRPKYDGHCRDLSPQEEQHLIAQGRAPVLRVKLPQTGVTQVDDLIKGHVEVDNAELDDFIILRSDGRPTYNFAVVVDDLSMKITHIIRGDEHLNNTPKQIHLYQAFDQPLPQFAHLPMVLDKERHKLSKRRSQIETSITTYREQGYLPEALLNFIARLGWSYDDRQEIFSLEELIEKFSLEQVGKSGAIFDEEKLLWFNQHYIVHGDPKRLGELLREFFVKGGHLSESEARAVPIEALAHAVDFLKERNRTLIDLADSASYLLTDKLSYDPDGAREFLTPDKLPLLKGLAMAFADLPDFKTATLDQAARAYLASKGKTLKDVAQTCRVAITGKTKGAGLFETMEFLSRERVIARLRQAITLISESSKGELR